MSSPPKHANQDEFPKTTIAQVSGRAIEAYLVTCGKCGITDKVSMQNNFPQSPDRTAHRFRAKGWNVSKGTRDRDVCPRCLRLKPSKEPEAMTPEIVEKLKIAFPHVNGATPPAEAIPAPATPTAAAPDFQSAPPPETRGENFPPAPVADKPETMTREDKRIIWAKVNEVYVDEKVGYGPGWSDARIAQEFAVPRAWVTKIREDDFGPEASNEEVRGLLVQAKGCVEETRKYLETLGRVTGENIEISKRVKNLEATAPGLVMQCERLDTHLRRISAFLGMK